MSTKKQRPNLINPKGKKIGGITIDCAYDALVDTEELRPNPRNPNKHPQKQLALLSKIIKAQGFRNPIIVSTLSGYVVKGHARLESARILGLKQCPVDYQDYQTEADEWADMVAAEDLETLIIAWLSYLTYHCRA